MERNIVNVNFSGQRTAQTRPLYRYDYGQWLVFSGISLPQVYEVHFSNSETGEATTQLGNESGVLIPDIYLRNDGRVFAWIYLHEGEDDGETVYKIVIPIVNRASITPEPPTPVQQDIITQAIAALNEAVEQTAADVEATAQSAENAHTSEINAAGNASAAAVSEHNASISAQQAAQLAAQSADAARQSSSYAAMSAQSASEASASAGTANTAKEAAVSAANTAITAKNDAQTSANAAAESATNAADSEREAAASASDAADSAEQAAHSVSQGGYITCEAVDEHLVFSIINWDDIHFRNNNEYLEVVYG